jgi:hypothetical protein
MIVGVMGSSVATRQKSWLLGAETKFAAVLKSPFLTIIITTKDNKK